MNRIRTIPVEQSPLAHRPASRVAKLNLLLACVSLSMLLYYVVQNNAMAVQVWRTRDAQGRLTALADDRNGLVARQAALDDRQQLIALVQRAGMVPAGTVVYLVQEQPIAAR
ncbi:MAG: hypothetical protein AAB375_00100 [Patescibacteria group bacterium]